MPYVNIPANVWTEIHTTTEDTAFQNRGGRNVFITTEATGSLDPAEGIAVGPMNIIVVQSGKTVSGYSVGGDLDVFYVGV